MQACTHVDYLILIFTHMLVSIIKQKLKLGDCVEECIVCGGRKGVPVHASHEDGGTSQAVLPLQRPLSGDHTPSEWSRDLAGGEALDRADSCCPQSVAEMSPRDRGQPTS